MKNDLKISLNLCLNELELIEKALTLLKRVSDNEDAKSLLETLEAHKKKHFQTKKSD